MPTTLVALDDSEGAARALDWAIAHAAADESFVLVTVLPAARAGQGYPPPHQSERHAAEEMLQKAADSATSKAGTSPSIKTEVLEGSATGEILDAAKRHGADHIVVGARGSGGFPRMLIGSVSSAVVHHAESPVTVIPAGARV